MPEKQRSQNRGHEFHIFIPKKEWDALRKLAEKNRRTKKEEALIAIERHVKDADRR